MISHARGQRFDLQQVGHEGLAVGLREGLESDLGERLAEQLARVADEGPAGGVCLGAHRRDEEDGQLPRERHELAGDVDGRRVGPVDVLADHHDRAARGQPAQEPVRRRDVTALEHVRRFGLDRLPRPQGQSEQVGQVHRGVLGLGPVHAQDVEEGGIAARASDSGAENVMKPTIDRSRSMSKW